VVLPVKLQRTGMLMIGTATETLVIA